jgi:hypothetical protein
MKDIVKNINLNPNEYQLLELKTGEVKEFKKGEIKIVKETGKVRIDYKNYVYFNVDKIIPLINKELTLQQMGLIPVLASNLLYNLNVCLDVDGAPFSTKTISQTIRKSLSPTKIMLNTLEDIGIIWYGKLDEFKRKVYVLNPFFVRKGKDYSKEIVKLFKENGSSSKGKKSESWSPNLEKWDSSSVNEKKSQPL